MGCVRSRPILKNTEDYTSSEQKDFMSKQGKEDVLRTVTDATEKDMCRKCSKKKKMLKNRDKTLEIPKPSAAQRHEKMDIASLANILALVREMLIILFGFDLVS
ncbi:hypothetical protein DPMN_182549 [Dreissena polymorpha]|uniref:Uncharacterized protein n=1 Tax=Dreissena polymorpha TaxID=45954 RepID=A0A9D4DEE5_DREPO|nr:hypothetical protein DPMN_182549 [Dreissena polymorpha]